MANADAGRLIGANLVIAPLLVSSLFICFDILVGIIRVTGSRSSILLLRCSVTCSDSCNRGSGIAELEIASAPCGFAADITLLVVLP